MTNNPFQKEESNARRRQASTACVDVVIVLVFCLAILGIAVSYMNMQRQISSVQDAVSKIEKSNWEVRSLLANQERRRDALTSQKVVEYARLHKMTLPAPGQVCIITKREQAQVPPLPNLQKQEVDVASMPAPFLTNELR